MLFSDIAIIDEHLDYREHRYVGVLGNRIAYVGEKPPANPTAYGEVYPGARHLLMPGMVNAHTHVPMQALRGWAENLPLQRWLTERIYPFEAQLDDQIAYQGTLLATAEMLRFGTTSFSDMYIWDDARLRALGESGMRANLCHGIVSFDADAAYRDMPDYRDNVHLVHDFQGAFDGRCRIDLCVHAEYSNTPEVIREVAIHAKELGTRLHIHLSETRAEHEGCKERHGGLTPAGFLETLGVFDVPVLAAHCVWLEPHDRDILAKRSATAVATPVSNLKLASGIANMPALIDVGVNVALGTDSVASNNNLNLWKEMALFGMIYRGTQLDPTLITPRQALFAATRAGAIAQGRDDAGLIREGYLADVEVVDIDRPWMEPSVNPLANLVFSAQGSDVVLTMVDGRVLYREGDYTTIDVERVQHEVARLTRGIVARL